MHNVLNDLSSNTTIDLDKEYENALKDEYFKLIVKKLKIKRDIAKKYTSLIEECSCEYRNCSNCKSILECKNNVEGYCKLPINNGDALSFEYKPCKYKKEITKKNEYLNNIKFFNTPKYVENANLDSIYKTDKNRFKVINYLMDFLDNIESSKETKGLYLHGNFGCGKTYLIAAIFNELAKSNIKSSIVFWPEFTRQAFYDDFNEKYDYIKRVPLLLIDDIGAEMVTDYNRDEILCPLLQYRMDNNLVTFFTSNLSLNELEQTLSKSKSGVDEVKAKRIICRIEQLTNQMEMISKNLRK